MKANASKHKAMSYTRMRDEARRLRDEIAALTTKAEAIDAAEDAEHGPDVRGDELPAELQRREERLAKIAAAKARLEARQAEEDRQKGRTPTDGRKSRGSKPFARDFGVPPDDAQDNFTDPESRIMKTSGGFDQCYNGQIAVDEASQVIVAAGLTNCNADNPELLPLIDQVQTIWGRGRRKCSLMRGIAARPRFRRSSRGASRPSFRSDMKCDRPSHRTRLMSRPCAWPRGSPVTRDGPATAAARPSSSPSWGGSKKPSAFAVS